jgi:hypothetical protein
VQTNYINFVYKVVFYVPFFEIAIGDPAPIAGTLVSARNTSLENLNHPETTPLCLGQFYVLAVSIALQEWWYPSCP